MLKRFFWQQKIIEQLSKGVMPFVDDIKKPACWHIKKDGRFQFNKGYKNRNRAERSISLFLLMVYEKPRIRRQLKLGPNFTLEQFKEVLQGLWHILIDTKLDLK